MEVPWLYNNTVELSEFLLKNSSDFHGYSAIIHRITFFSYGPTRRDLGSYRVQPGIRAKFRSASLQAAAAVPLKLFSGALAEMNHQQAPRKALTNY